ncbi:MAG: VWA domain-containing protein [Lachnospiraceae bacterium]|nr:VWA domain-containing protein [Lachnospiraceae bacterium]
MKKGLTELVFILDRSGSMSGLESDTIGGFNSMIKKQREEEGEANVTTVLFDDNYELLHDRINVNDLKDMTSKDYFVGGCTALLDAIGTTIKSVNKKQNELPEDEQAEKVIFVITTDGMENASHKYDRDKIKKMIEKKQTKKNWQFMFLGANMDAVSEAGRIGIRAKRAFKYTNDSEGVQLNYEAVGGTISAMRAMPCAMAMDEVDDSFFEKVKEHAES